MSAATFTFDEAKHLYMDANGVVVPSVTQVLKAVGLVNFDHINPAVLERKRQLGSLVHKVTELYDRGENLSDYEIPDEVWPYFDGYVNFRNDCAFTPELVEHQLLVEYYSMRYGMKLDREGLIRGVRHIIELKCGAGQDPVWGVQLAGYSIGRTEKNRPPSLARAAVQLGPQFPRNYKIHAYDDPADYQVWVSSLACATWMQNKQKLVIEDVPERLVA